MYCQHCGEDTPNDAKFCPQCGEKILTLTDTKRLRYAKRALAVVVPWVLVRIAVTWLNRFLYMLEPGWLIIALMVLIDEAAPPVAGFAALIWQFYREAEEDGELEQILGKKPRDPFTIAEEECTDRHQVVSCSPIAGNDFDSAYQQSHAFVEPSPQPSAESWNREIPKDDILSVFSLRPYYDCNYSCCVSEQYGENPSRFVDLSSFVVLDLETTGLNVANSKIIEVAAVKFDHFQVVDTFAKLVNPGVPLPSRITNLTGITQKELDHAQVWSEIEGDFLNFIGDYPLVGHNLISFDIRFIQAAVGYPITNPLIDTLEYSRNAFPELPRHKLSFLKSVLGINVEKSHRALDDVKTTFFLLMACMRKDFENNTDSGDGDMTFQPIFYAPPKSEQPKWKRKDDVDLKSIVPTCDVDLSSPLMGKRIVFTGTLSIPREQAMQMAVNSGALLRSSVSGKTDYLVVGTQDRSIVGADGMSTKEEKAHALNEFGNGNIQIIGEDAFLRLIHNK